ncbi:hypothetical protein RHIZO_02986 [Rhizobiaceae bacterium]|nr:hypothetical protein RHIZO_02986 [Rhizobiaceae bacterium]
MDPVTLTFYGIVCGLLAGFVPQSSRAVRIAIGVGVGLVAAALLPPLRAALGL